MANYYFLVASFPPLVLGQKPDLTFKELRSLLDLNLTREDLRLVEELLRPIDLYNLRAFWLGFPLDDRGAWQAKDLEEELLVQDSLPDFVIEFLDRYESTEERLRYFSSLYTSFYRDLQPRRRGFLKRYYAFERELRLVLTALRAKEQGRDLLRELQFEDPTDPFIAAILAQKDAPDYAPPTEYEDLKTLFVENRGDPQELERFVSEYRFRKIEEMEEAQDFGIDRVLAFIARFMIVIALADQDQQKGMEYLSQYE